ncbi:MAG TPA: DinB family protein [Tepidisphaeraceae bacterium]|nr:DinB family protein [Tepidisphaeraceae bacterium]
MADETLLLLTKDVRGKTLRILEGITDEQARYAPPGLQNSILWHAGHSLVVVEHLSVMPATGKGPSYPKEWFDKFSWTSKPATVTEWPKVHEVIERLKRQFETLMAAISGLSEQQLAAATGDPAKGRNVRWSILHGLHDEAGHQGEMWLLKKLQAKGL